MSWSHEGAQRERTSLAWNRTGLSLLVGSGVLLALASFPGPEDIVAVLVAAAGMLALRTGRRRAIQAAHQPLDAVRAEPALLAVIAGVATLLAGASLWLVLV